MSAGHVLVACDKFKGSLTADEVLAHIEQGLLRADPDREVRTVVVADGGDGTLAAAFSAGFDRVPVTVEGPTGEPVETAYAVKDGTAVVEMADACGLVRLPNRELAPLTASSRGAGQVLAAALEAGVQRIVFGVGGSASTDGGAGLLQALGARLLDAQGNEVAVGGGPLGQLARIDLDDLHPRLRDVQLTLASDVNNPLLGDQGAVAIFAPQKGADAAQQEQLEAALTTFSDLVTAAVGRDDTQRPGAGAAGGVGYAAMAALGADMRPGIELMLDLTGFDAMLPGATLVVTGEGSLDEQTLLGKAPAGVAAAARAQGIPVVAVCGRSLLTAQQAADSGIEQVYALTDLEPDPSVCMRDAGRLLTDLAERVGREHPRG
ncbi:glycerate kinase [Kineosphaera limosa]|uniref:Putative glycerate kinase n=1 Tax=Kineosphaera limosa NBRC 100340 TaxID=1184609 RepID=K6VH38_9MICO|nr:glycerate kinase [Kineosphaera limosa]NYD99945.1 glycerate kinase [Kineosphaera limosa]GAB95518.1 putative glycerate kinase [Kineosphaera limosa NBRC 100340]